MFESYIPENWAEKKEYIRENLRMKRVSESGELDVSGFINREGITLQDLVYALNHKGEFKGALDKAMSINGEIEIKARELEDFIKELESYAVSVCDVFVLTSITVKNLELITGALGENLKFVDLFQKIETIEVTGNVKKDDVLKCINVLKNYNCFPKSVLISGGVTSEDLVMLRVITNLGISRSYEVKDITLEKLFQHFHSQLKGEQDVTKSDIEGFVGVACAKMRLEDKNISFGKALRLLSKFDWDFLELNKVKSLIEDIRAEQPLRKDIYHLGEKENLHFYMVKVDDHNAEAWKSYAYAEKQGYGISKSQQKASVGIIGFTPSFNYYDNDATETWVAFVSDKALKDPTMPDKSSIEMCVTMMTSENSPFTSHVGIFRGSSYHGETHKDLAMQLHSFIAKATLQDHSNKYYMINTPAQMMREIIIKALEKHFGDSAEHIYVGDGSGFNSPEISGSLEQLQESHSAMVTAGFYNTDRMIGDAYECAKKIAFAKQEIALESGKLKAPISAASRSSNSCKSFEVKDKTGGTICKLGREEMEGEFAWFFESPYLFRGQVHDTMITLNLSELSELRNFAGQVEHMFE